MALSQLQITQSFTVVCSGRGRWDDARGLSTAASGRDLLAFHSSPSGKACPAPSVTRAPMASLLSPRHQESPGKISICVPPINNIDWLLTSCLPEVPNNPNTTNVLPSPCPPLYRNIPGGGKGCLEVALEVPCWLSQSVLSIFHTEIDTFPGLINLTSQPRWPRSSDS